MEKYSALLDDRFDDFVISENCLEKQDNKGIEGTQLKNLF